MDEKQAEGQGGAGELTNRGDSTAFADVVGLCAEDWRLTLGALTALLFAAVSQVGIFVTSGWFSWSLYPQVVLHIVRRRQKI